MMGEEKRQGAGKASARNFSGGRRKARARGGDRHGRSATEK